MENTKKTGIRALAWVLACALIALSIPLFTIVPNVTASADTTVASWTSTNGAGGKNGTDTIETNDGYAGTSGGVSTSWGSFVSNIQTLTADQYVEFVYTGNFTGATAGSTWLRGFLWSGYGWGSQFFATSVSDSKIVVRVEGPMSPLRSNFGLTVQGLSAFPDPSTVTLTVTVYKKGGGEEPVTEPTIPVTDPTNPTTPSGEPTIGETVDLIKDIICLSDGSILVEKSGSTFTFEQPSSWKSWQIFYTDEAKQFTPAAGKPLYLVYDFDANGQTQLCLGSGYTNSVASKIAQAAKKDMATDNALAAGTYTGKIEITKDMIGETGNIGVVGTGATIRKFQLATEGDPTEPSESETEPSASETEPELTDNLLVNGDFKVVPVNTDKYNSYLFDESGIGWKNGGINSGSSSFVAGEWTITCGNKDGNGIYQDVTLESGKSYTISGNVSSGKINLLIDNESVLTDCSGDFSYTFTAASDTVNFAFYKYNANFAITSAVLVCSGDTPSESESEPSASETEPTQPVGGDQVIASWKTNGVNYTYLHQGKEYVNVYGGRVGIDGKTWKQFANEICTSISADEYMVYELNADIPGAIAANVSLNNTGYNNTTAVVESATDSYIRIRMDGPFTTTNHGDPGLNLTISTGMNSQASQETAVVTITVYKKGAAPTEPEIPDEVKDAKYSASLTLNDNININFKMTGFGDGFELSKLAVTVNDSPISLSMQSGAVVGLLAAVAPNKMADDLNVVVKYNDIQAKAFTYSVRAYCESVFGKYGATDPLYKLCEAVLNYGAATATYTKADDANKNVNAGYVINFSDANYIPESKLKLVGNHITAATCNLTLKSTITMNINVTLPAGKTINTTDPTNPDNEGSFVILSSANTLVDAQNIEVTDNGGNNYTISITNITSSKLDREYTLMFWDDVKTASSLADVASSITFGVYNYCYEAQVQTSEAFTTDLKTLCKAIYNYGRAAKTYHPD